MADRNPDNVNFPPFETEDLRSNLAKFLNTPFGVGSKMMPIGNYRWGVYAFLTTTKSQSTSARPTRWSGPVSGGT
ncbi:MAG TPA: hypothetical protein VF499_12535 [Afipia sp.]